MIKSRKISTTSQSLPLLFAKTVFSEQPVSLPPTFCCVRLYPNLNIVLQERNNEKKLNGTEAKKESFNNATLSLLYNQSTSCTCDRVGEKYNLRSKCLGQSTKYKDVFEDNNHNATVNVYLLYYNADFDQYKIDGLSF